MSNKLNQRDALLRTKNGFTLIEIVISISILSIILSITYSAMSSIMRSKSVLDDRREAGAMSYAVLNRMTREFQMAYNGIGLLPRQDDPKRTKSPADYNMIGEQKQLSNGKRGDSITFIALEAGQYLPDGGTHSGLVQITYRVEDNPELDNSTSPQRYILVREETPYLAVERAFAKTMIFPVVENVVGLEYRYYDKNEDTFRDAWNPEENRGLPSQLELKIELASPSGEISTFITTVPLRSIN